MASKPTRIAPPAIIADAASALYGQIAASTKIPDDQRELWLSATTKAFNQLMEGVRFERREDDTFVFPSRTRSGLAHHVNGTCDCEATAEQGQPCWHRAAKRLMLLIEDAARPDPEPAAPAPHAQQPAAIPPSGKYMMIDPESGDIALFYGGELVGFAENEAVAEQLLDEFLDLRRVQRAETARPPQTAPAPRPRPQPARPGPGRNPRVAVVAGHARSAQEEIDDLYPPRR